MTNSIKGKNSNYVIIYYKICNESFYIYTKLPKFININLELKLQSFQ